MVLLRKVFCDCTQKRGVICCHFYPWNHISLMSLQRKLQMPGVLQVQPFLTFWTKELRRKVFSWPWFSSQEPDQDFSGGKGYVYPYYTKTDASLLGYIHTFMAVQIEWSFPTSPHSWLILATSSSPNYNSERRQLIKIPQETGRLRLVRQV